MRRAPKYDEVNVDCSDKEVSSELKDLIKITSDFARGEAPLQILKQTLEIALKVAGGQRVILVVKPEHLTTLFSSEIVQEGSARLGPSVEIISSGPLVPVIRDWEDTTKPVSIEEGAILILPFIGAGLAILEPSVNFSREGSLNTILQIVTNLAAGVLSNALQLGVSQQRTVTLEETRQRLRDQNVLLRELAVVDELTGLYNRRFFERRLAYEFERFKRYSHPLSILIIDVDYFKKVNDTYGHNAGDEVLRHLAQHAQTTLRKIDIVARYGGEEFVAILPDTDQSGALTAAERLRVAISSTSVRFGEDEICITISGGIVTISREFSGDVESLIRFADQALYQAKAQGRNRIVVAIDI
jgi:diguanylate cyclase (GGDEF)-like protein